MFRTPIAMVLGLSALAAGCEKKDQPPKVTAHDVERKVAEAAGTAADYARQEKDEYVAQAQKAVDGAKGEVDRLKAAAARARAGAKGRLQRQVGSLEARCQVAERRLGELKAASGEAWKDLKAGVDRAVEDLRQPPAKAGLPASSSASR